MDKPEAVVVKREGDEPVRVKKLAWWQAIAVRVGRTYIMSVLGLLGATNSGSIPALPILDFYHNLRLSATSSLAVAVVCLLWNAAELLAKLDQTNPEWRA